MKQILQSRFKIVFLGILIILFSLLQSCGEKSKGNPTDKTTYTDTVSVEMQVAKTNELTITKTFSGSLEGEEQANIIAKIAERIMKINIKVGDYVKAGDILFELDKAGAQSQFYQAQAGFLNAQKNFDRMQNLLKVGAVSQQAYDAVQTQFEVAKANFDAARSTVEITSPLSGIITAINVNIGDLANPQMPMATVANIQTMRAKFNVGEIDVPNFFVGQSAQIYSEMNSDLVQTGKVFQISKSANIQSRTFEIQARFSNTKDRWFKPGMFCRVKVDLKSKKNALTIPYSAVYKEDNTDGVFVISNNKTIYKQIITGLTDGNSIEVISGLKAGDQVVTVGMSNLKDGTVVIISNK
jgi:RND family efflux transporter MFP subunit